MPASPRSRTGAPALLFDRLTDEKPQVSVEANPLRIYDLHTLRDSVAREVERLLNTRRPVMYGQEAGAEGTVLTYGVGDHAMESVLSDRGRQTVCSDMRRAIERYEPRLRKVKVEVLQVDKNAATLTVQIAGELRSGPVHEQVFFPVAVRLDGDRRGQ